MDNEYVKSVIKGLTVAHVCLGFAAMAGIVTVFAVGWTQWPLLVVWVPTVLTVIFLAVTMMLLQKDMVAQREERKKDH